MEEGNSNWSNDRNRVLGSRFNSSFAEHSIYNSIRSGHLSRIAENLSRSHGPLTLGRAQEEGSRLIRNNFNSVFNELGPLMDTVISGEGSRLNLSSWIRRQHDSDRNSQQNGISSTSQSTIIDFGNSSDPIGILSQANVFQPIQTNILSFPYQDNQSANARESGETETSGIVHGNYVNVQPEASSGIHQNSSTNNNINSGNNAVAISPGPDVENVQTETSNPDVQSIVTFFHKYIPFLMILLGKAIYDHRTGILIFLGLLVTFTHADSVVKREIAKQSRRSLLSLFILFINLFFCICFIYYIFQDQHLYKSLILIPPYSQPLNLWDLLWIVGITDFILKFITIQIKAGMACFPARLLPYSARGKWYLFLESTSQLYRGLIPIQPWLYYLSESYQGPEKVVGVFLSAAYMVSKWNDITSKVKLFKEAFWKLLQKVSLGVSPNKEQLDTAGSQCPICHDDYDAPVLLHCRHVFCEACVTSWFDREQTCPLCRTKVADDPTWKDGATTFFAQLF